jgi:hypothetical protein
MSWKELKTPITRFRLRINFYQPTSRRVAFSDRLLALLTSDKLDKPAWIILGLAGLMILGQLLRWYFFLR